MHGQGSDFVRNMQLEENLGLFPMVARTLSVFTELFAGDPYQPFSHNGIHLVRLKPVADASKTSAQSTLVSGISKIQALISLRDSLSVS